MTHGTSPGAGCPWARARSRVSTTFGQPGRRRAFYGCPVTVARRARSGGPAARVRYLGWSSISPAFLSSSKWFLISVVRFLAVRPASPYA